MSAATAALLAGAGTLGTLLATALWRVLGRVLRQFGEHLAELARLPESLDGLADAMERLGERVTHLEKEVGVTP